jgi:hypothetical protein
MVMARSTLSTSARPLPLNRDSARAVMDGVHRGHVLDAFLTKTPNYILKQGRRTNSNG